MRAKLSILFLAVALVGCAANVKDEPLTTVPGQVTITEYDRTNKAVGSYLVDGTKCRRSLGAGTLTVPGADHPLKNYSVDR